MTRAPLARLLCPCLLVLAGAPPLLAQEEDIRPSAERCRQVARSVMKKLEPLGYGVDLKRLEVVVKNREQSVPDLTFSQDLFFPPDRLRHFCFLLHALGVLPRDDVELLRKAAREAALKALQAYYLPGKNRLVFLDTAAGREGRALGGLKTIVAHELVHAHQDQKLDLVKLLTKDAATLEQVRILSCMIEGEAECVSLAVRIGEERLRKAEPEELRSDVETLLAGETALMYQAGRVFLAGRYRSGGWAAVRRSLREPPTSTEQVLHPEKTGKDLPTRVALPDLPFQKLYEDTLGELQIYLLLTTLDPEQAHLASVGWDGDRLQVFRDDDAKGARVAVWRSVWDRPEDARQFARVLRACPGVVTVRGRVVDWRSPGPAEMTRRIDVLLAKPPVVHVQEPGAEESTRLLEEAWRKKQAKRPAVKGKRWVHDAVGMRLAMPPGWEEMTFRGQRFLKKESATSHGFTTNINVQVLSGMGQSLDDLMRLNAQQIEQMPAFDLISQRKRKVSGRDVIRLELASAAANQRKLHCLGVIYLRGGKQVVVTATTTEDLWPAQKSELEAMLLGLEIDDVP